MLLYTIKQDRGAGRIIKLSDYGQNLVVTDICQDHNHVVYKIRVVSYISVIFPVTNLNNVYN